jgi:hypothetical protein
MKDDKDASSHRGTPALIGSAPGSGHGPFLTICQIGRQRAGAQQNGQFIGAVGREISGVCPCPEDRFSITGAK